MRRSLGCVLLLVTACVAPSADDEDAQVSGLPDGGHDANVADAFMSRIPLPSDAASVGPDAAHYGLPDDPEWVPMDIPAGVCPVERATHPERVVSFAWNDCGAGCRELATTPTEAYARFSTSGERPAMWLEIADDTTAVTVLSDLDGGVLGAWRRPRSFACTGFRLGAGEGRAALLLHYDHAGSDAQLWVDDLDHIGMLDGPGLALPALGTSDDVFVASSVVAIGGPPSSVVVDASGARSVDGWAVEAVAGDVVLTSRGVGYFGAGAEVTTPTTGPTALLGGLVAPWTDGTWLVWSEVNDLDLETGAFRSITLRVSPFGTTAELVPTTLIEVASPVSARLGYPYVAIDGDETDVPLTLLDARDGTRRTLARPFPRYTTLAVSPTEVFVRALGGPSTRRYAIESIALAP